MYRENVKNYNVKSVPTIPPLPYRLQVIPNSPTSVRFREARHPHCPQRWENEEPVTVVKN
jgi:hypothetical protein